MSESKFLIDIGKRIQTLRKTRKMTLQDLGNLCDADKSAMHRIESGRNISLLKLRKIAKGLDVPVTIFFHPEFKDPLDNKLK